MLIGYADEMNSQDVSCLAEWADYHAKGTPNGDWKRAYALIREGADLLLRRRALTNFNPEYEPPVEGPNLLKKQKSSLAQLLAKPLVSGRASEQAKAEEKPQSTPFFDQVVAGASGTESFEALLTKITGPLDPATIPQFPTAQ